MTDARQGYLLVLELVHGKIRLAGVAEIDNYMESKHPVAADDWFVLLLDPAEHCLGTIKMENPAHFSPSLSAGQAIPATVKIPRLSGMAAISIRSQSLGEQLRIPVNAAFAAEAAGRRKQFLDHDRENRRLLAEPALRNERAASPAAQANPATRIEDLPASSRRPLQEEMARLAEQVGEFGSEAVNLAAKMGIDPAEALRYGVPPASGAAPPITAPGLLAAAYTLSGQVTDAVTGAPVSGTYLSFQQYDTSSRYVGSLGPTYSDANGYYSVGVDAGRVTVWPSYNSAGKKYASIGASFDIKGNTTGNIKAYPGVVLSGNVSDAKGKGIAGAVVWCNVSSAGSTYGMTSSASGSYSITVPANMDVRIYVTAPLPYFAPPDEPHVIFTADTVRNYTLETGLVVSGTVTGPAGDAIQGASIILRQLASTSTSTPYATASTNASGKFSLAVSGTKQPDTYVIAAYAPGYVLQTASLEVTGDTSLDFRLEKGFTVSGLVRQASGAPASGARVRAFQDGVFAVSALTKSDGTYSCALPAGRFDFEVLPPFPDPGGAAPARSGNVTVSDNTALDFSLPAAAGILTVKLFYPDQATQLLYSRTYFTRFELSQFGRTVQAGFDAQATSGYDTGREKYYRQVIFYLDNARYTLLVLPMGGIPIRVRDVVVSGQADVSVDIPAPLLWTGTLRGADNKPLAGVYVESANDLADVASTTVTDAAGGFKIFYTPNGFVRFYADAGSNSMPYTERLGAVTTGREADVLLEQFPAIADSGAVLTQIYGVTDRNARWNIVMIGDGYTGVKETYTDLNGNGQWDGILYYDLNKNGVWDTGEPYRRYGSAAAPSAGKDPTTGNEPFTDLNGDGVPNLHDQELFDRNTLDTARSLFGQDEWRKHRDAFNVFRIRLVSKQAGHKLFDQNGMLIIDRDTILGSYLNTPERNWLFNTDYTLVAQYVNQYVPEWDTRIVLVNQPIPMGRANSYILTYGGEVTSLANSVVIAHEMGHNVGLLADEYMEYAETYKGAESYSRNVTSLTDPARIPWKHLIAATKEIPSVRESAGVGLYEGAGYYTGGKYRPTEYCMMVSGLRYCPVCTEEIEIRLAEITGSVPNAVPRMPSLVSSGLYPEFTWDAVAGVSHYLFELQTADGGTVVASYDIYGTSFVMPFALTAGTEYRWRLRPASNTALGAWTSWIRFKAQAAVALSTGTFAHIAAGGKYQTSMTVINLGQSAANVSVSQTRFDGTPFDGGSSATNLHVQPGGTARIDARLAGAVVSGFAGISSDGLVSGTALFKTLAGELVISEAGVGFSRPVRQFTIYVDNLNDAVSGYAVANAGAKAANVKLTLRNAAGRVIDASDILLPATQQKAEYAYQRFAAAAAGFEGSIEFSSDQDIAAVALRYDNAAQDVFSTIPVLDDDAGTTVYFPQIADGGGYRTNLVLLNPGSADTTAKLEFYSSDGSALPLTIGGIVQTSVQLDLKAKGAARLFTDGASSVTRSGWVKVTSPTAISGSAIFQTLSGKTILSEAGVGSSPPAPHMVAYVETLGSTQSGIAICNPNSSSVTLSLNLKNSAGETAASTTVILPAYGHLARFFTEWFSRGFTEFEGTLEILSTAPVSAVALRYDNPGSNVFATLPVAIVR